MRTHCLPLLLWIGIHICSATLFGQPHTDTKAPTTAVVAVANKLEFHIRFHDRGQLQLCCWIAT